MSANDTQIDGNHYQKRKIQHWDYCKDMPYLEGRCIAYIDRHQNKNGMRDVLKAFHFLQKIAEERYGVIVEIHQVNEEPDCGPTPGYVNQDPDIGVV